MAKRSKRYLIEFDKEEGRILFKSLLTPLDYEWVSDVQGLPGHPPYGVIFRGTAAQRRNAELKLKMSCFDPYSFTINAI